MYSSSTAPLNIFAMCLKERKCTLELYDGTFWVQIHWMSHRFLLTFKISSVTVGVESKIITNHYFIFYVNLYLLKEMKKQSDAQSVSLLH